MNESKRQPQSNAPIVPIWRFLYRVAGIFLLVAATLLIIISAIAPEFQLSEKILFWLFTALLCRLSLSAVLPTVHSRLRFQWTTDRDAPPPKCSRREKAYFIILAILLISCFIPLWNQNAQLTFFQTDSVRFYGYHYLVRHCLIDLHQLPLRTHLGNGGFPMSGHPEFVWPNPCLFFSLIFGEILGLKAWWCFLLYIQGIGVFLLARCELHTGFGAAVTTSLLAAFSPWITRALSDGNYYAVPYAFTGLLLYLMCRARRSWPALLCFAALMCFLGFDCYYYTASVGIFLIVFAVLSIPTIESRALTLDFSLLRVLFLSALIILPLGMIKYLPMADFMTTPTLQVRIFTEPEEAKIGGQPVYDSSFIDAYHLRDLIHHLTERTGFLSIGWPLLVFGIAGLAIRKKISTKWLWALWIMVALSMAFNSPLDIFRVLWQYGFIFKTMRHPASYFDYFIMLILILGFGMLIDYAMRRQRIRYLGGLMSLIAITIMVTRHQAVLNVSATTASPVSQHLQRYSLPDGFYQVEYQGTHQGREYPIIYKGIGMIDWYCSFQLPTQVQPRYFVTNDGFVENEHYRGEAYILPGGSVIPLRKVTPTRIDLIGEVKSGELLVINQNYHPYWRCNSGAIANYNGLLAIQGPTVRQSASMNLSLWYEDEAFRLGFFITLLATLALSSRTIFDKRLDRSVDRDYG